MKTPASEPRRARSSRTPAERTTFAATPPSRIRPGAFLGQRYLLMEKLGEGGIGVVWKAEDQRLDRVVALKVLREQRAGSADARTRIVREAHAAASIEHPGINTVYDAGEDDGLYYIALGYVEGETVCDRLERGAMPPEEVLRITSAMAEALGFAHSRGLLHRDVSSRNVMLAQDGRVLLLDFGVALMRDSLRITRKGRIVGTPAYLSPEAARGVVMDGRADLYSLAVLAYEMLTSTLPYPAVSADQIMFAVIHEPPVPPSRHRTDLPPSVDEFFARALSKDPSDRFANGTEFRAALQDAFRGVSFSGATTRHTTPRTTGALRRTPIPEYLQIAVLPFRDISGSAPEAQAFAHGLAEAASVALARYPNVQVVPPAAVAASGIGEHEPLRLAREFGVNVVLGGQVRREGDRVRVSFLALQPLLGVQIAAESVDGTVGRLLDLEDALAKMLAKCLNLRPLLPTHAAPALSGPVAREQFLKALGYLQRYDQDVMVDAALDVLVRLTEGAGASAEIYGALARAYMAKYQLSKSPEYLEQAMTAAERAHELDAHSPAVLVTLGQLRTQQGRYQDAIEVYEAALGQQPNLPEAVLGIAWAHAHLGHFDEAEALLKRSAELRPRYWASYSYLGRLYFENGRPQDAARCFRKVVDLVPDSARGWANLGGAYFQMGRLKDALNCYHRSLDPQPTANALSSLGTVHFFLGNYLEAVQAFERATVLEPEKPVLWGNLADGYRWASGLESQAPDALERAIALQRRLLEVNPEDCERWAQYADWLAKLGRTADALQAIEKSLALNGHDACIARAVFVYHFAGERAKAIDAARKAIAHGYGLMDLTRNPDLADLRRTPELASLLSPRKKRTTSMDGSPEPH